MSRGSCSRVREDGARDGQEDRAASAVMRSLYRPVVVKKELIPKAKLLIYQSIYFPAWALGID